MSVPVPSFQLEALDALARIIGDNYSIDQAKRLFERSGYRGMITPEVKRYSGILSILEPAVQPSVLHQERPVTAKLVAQAFEYMSRDSVLNVVRALCSPQAYIGKPEQFHRVIGRVNEVLKFYGIRVNQAGELVRARRSSAVRVTKSDDQRAFDARAFHRKVVEHGRSRFAEGNYFHSVFECCKAFDVAVRENSGIEKSGDALMGEAFRLNGVVRLNLASSQSEKDEQQGIMFICKGLMGAIRNAQAHEPELKWQMTQQDALDVLGLLSFVFRKLENATVVKDASSGGVKVKL